MTAEAHPASSGWIQFSLVYMELTAEKSLDEAIPWCGQQFGCYMYMSITSDNIYSIVFLYMSRIQSESYFVKDRCICYSSLQLDGFLQWIRVHCVGVHAVFLNFINCLVSHFKLFVNCFRMQNALQLWLTEMGATWI